MAAHIQIEELIRRGRYLEARALAGAALKADPEERLMQCYALALSKSGAPEAAREFLEPLYNKNPDNPETAGILGGIYKELFRKNQQTHFAKLSRDTYLKNFQATQNYYTGINAAAMSAMVMQAARAREIAAQVTASIHPETQDFWELATLAEGHLLLKDRELALMYFTRARRAAATDWGKITSVYNQLWLLNHFIPVAKDILSLFSPPRVAAFAGHMIDRPGRPTPRLPADLEEPIRDAIRASIRLMNIQIGFCSLACGSDILFAEAMIEAGGEVNAVLPFRQDDFEEVSLRFAGTQWVERFRRLVALLSPRYLTREGYLGHDDLFSLQSNVLFGSALMRARMYHQEPYLLTVLSNTDLLRKKGGTRDALGYWPFPANMVNINPETYLPATAHGGTPASPDPAVQHVSDRPVQYLVRANATHLALPDRDRFEKLLAEFAAEPRLVVERQDFVYTLAFEYIAPALNFIRQALLLFDGSKGSPLGSLAVHAGPHDRRPGTASESMRRLDALSQFAQPGSALASYPFAALLALEANWLDIAFAGSVAGNNAEDEPAYQITLKRVQ